MNHTPSTRSRHALRWVLGVALAFVVLMLVGLQMAERRAAEEWERALAHLQDSGWKLAEYSIAYSDGRVESGTVSVRGNYLGSARECSLGKGPLSVVLLQHRRFFGSSMRGAIGPFDEAHWTDIEALLQEVGVDIELAVEP